MLELLEIAPPEEGRHQRFYGVYQAIVTDIKDPDGQGRVKVKLPWSPDSGGGYAVWARVAVLMAGNNRGTWFIPDANDEVLVAFAAGDPRQPFVVGCLWNGKDAPPESMDSSGNNYKKVIRSRNGVKITLDDQDGKETLILETPSGQKLTLADGPSSVELIDAGGNSIKFEQSGMTINAPSQLTIKSGTIKVQAGMVQVDAGMSKFSGVVKSDVCLTNSVVGSSYTPGAGNIW
jgi:uncharacterized protein involved in type VI secretion and phage assembly